MVWMNLMSHRVNEFCVMSQKTFWKKANDSNKRYVHVKETKVSDQNEKESMLIWYIILVSSR